MDNNEIYKCKDIANWFISKDREYSHECPIHILRVQKLIYFANGIWLVKTGKPLIQEKFKAWNYCPLIYELYNYMQLSMEYEIGMYIGKDEDKNILSEEVKKLLASVWQRFDRSYDTLHSATSIKCGAWDKAPMLDSELSNEDIIEEFKNIHMPLFNIK